VDFINATQHGTRNNVPQAVFHLPATSLRPIKTSFPLATDFKEGAKSPKLSERSQQVVIQNWIFKMLGSNPLTPNPQLMGVMFLSGATGFLVNTKSG
jgi:hypothetical protein